MHTLESRHPEAVELAETLQKQNPAWTPLKCATVAKRQVTESSALRT